MKQITDSLKWSSRQTLRKTKKKGTRQIINSRNERRDMTTGPVDSKKETMEYCEWLYTHKTWQLRGNRPIPKKHTDYHKSPNMK